MPCREADSEQRMTDALREEAWSLILEGEYPAAIERLDRALEQRPESSWALGSGNQGDSPLEDLVDGCPEIAQAPQP